MSNGNRVSVWNVSQENKKPPVRLLDTQNIHVISIHCSFLSSTLGILAF